LKWLCEWLTALFVCVCVLLLVRTAWLRAVCMSTMLSLFYSPVSSAIWLILVMFTLHDWELCVCIQCWVCSTRQCRQPSGSFLWCSQLSYPCSHVVCSAIFLAFTFTWVSRTLWVQCRYFYPRRNMNSTSHFTHTVNSIERLLTVL